MAIAVSMLLLIVCANIASILLARGYARRREMGLRIAMGASHGRVRVQALTESALLSLFGFPPGVMIAYWCAHAVGAARPPLPQNWVLLRGTDLLAGASLAPNARVLGFAIGVAALATLLFGIGPAIAQSRVDAARLITSGGDTNASPPVRGRQWLVLSQIALATMLLVVAGLMARSLRALLHTDLGFQAQGVVAFQLTSTDRSTAAQVRRDAFFRDMAAVPGVQGVASAGCVPFDLRCMFTLGVKASGEGDASAQPVEVDVRAVSPEYFRVLRIPVVAGRPLAVADTIAGMGRVLISETAARQLFGGAARSVGRALVVENSAATPLTVVGVVHDVRFRSVEALPAAAIYYVRSEDSQAPRYQATAFFRTSLPDNAAIVMITRQLRASGAPMAVAEARSLTDLVRAATATTRFVAMLLLGFGTAALILAALGVYGIIAYIVAQRSRELSIRLMLGASSTRLSSDIAASGVALIGGGIGLGLLGALAAFRVISAFVFGVTMFDAATLTAVVALVGAAGAAATFVSTLRVRRIDAAQALRT
jgi:predicted permease